MAAIALIAAGAAIGADGAAPSAAAFTSLPTATVTAETTVTATARSEVTVTATATATVTKKTRTTVTAEPSQKQAAAPPASSLDPRFPYCYNAIDAGYGPYVRGQDPEYEWYRDADGDGVVCET